jgi:hypothetical protein
LRQRSSQKIANAKSSRVSEYALGITAYVQNVCDTASARVARRLAASEPVAILSAANSTTSASAAKKAEEKFTRQAASPKGK